MRVANIALGLALTALVLGLTLGLDVQIPQGFPLQDKAEHLAAFSALGFVWSFGVKRAWTVLVFVSLIGLALAIEALQPLVTTHREASLWDAGAGVLGAGAGWLGAVFAVMAARAVR